MQAKRNCLVLFVSWEEKIQEEKHFLSWAASCNCSFYFLNCGLLCLLFTCLSFSNSLHLTPRNFNPLLKGGSQLGLPSQAASGGGGTWPSASDQKSHCDLRRQRNMDLIVQKRGQDHTVDADSWGFSWVWQRVLMTMLWAFASDDLFCFKNIT